MQLQNSALWRTQALINGEWLAGSRQFAVLNPADGSVLAQVADLGADDTRRAIEAAAAAMPAWQQLPAVQRSNVLWRWYELLLDNQEDLARLMTAEQGKPLARMANSRLIASSQRLRRPSFSSLMAIFQTCIIAISPVPGRPQNGGTNHRGRGG